MQIFFWKNLPEARNIMDLDDFSQDSWLNMEVMVSFPSGADPTLTFQLLAQVCKAQPYEVKYYHYS